MATPDPYAVLGVARTATREEIARAYRSAVKRSHPDTGARTSPVQMARLTDAWRILGDPVRRARWDREHARVIDPPPWTAPVVRPQPIRNERPAAPPTGIDSGWVAVAVVSAIAIVLGGVMLFVALVAEPPSRTLEYAGAGVRFDYPDAWTLTEASEEPATHRVIAHLTSFSTGEDERCTVFVVRCRWEGAALPAGGASLQIFEFRGSRPPEPEPDPAVRIGGGASARAQTTVGDEFLSAWWQLSPSDFPDRWIEVRAEIRGGDLERARRMAQVDALLDSFEFADGS